MYTEGKQNTNYNILILSTIFEIRCNCKHSECDELNFYVNNALHCNRIFEIPIL